MAVPLSLKLLGTERYGLWLTVGSLVAWLGMTEFGLSRGMINAVAEASGRDDFPELRRLISTGFLAFALVSLLAALIVIPASRSTAVLSLLGVSGNTALAKDARLLVLVCGLFASASLVLPVVSSVCQGLQEGYLAAYFQGGATLVGLLALLAVYAAKGSLLEYAIAMAAPALLANAVLAVWLFSSRHPQLCPSF